MNPAKHKSVNKIIVNLPCWGRSRETGWRLLNAVRSSHVWIQGVVVHINPTKPTHELKRANIVRVFSNVCFICFLRRRAWPYFFKAQGSLSSVNQSSLNPVDIHLLFIYILSHTRLINLPMQSLVWHSLLKCILHLYLSYIWHVAVTVGRHTYLVCQKSE